MRGGSILKSRQGGELVLFIGDKILISKLAFPRVEIVWSNRASLRHRTCWSDYSYASVI
jgi:hypothetical protein